MRIFGFHHLALRCPDLEASIAFYEGLGGVREQAWGDETKRICLVNMGEGNRMELFSGGSAQNTAPEGPFLHLAFEVDDVAAAVQRALELGAVEEKPVTSLTLPDQEHPLPVTLAFVRGPAGESIEFFHVR